MSEPDPGSHALQNVMRPHVALYSAVDDVLTHYDVDLDAATLTKRASVRTPAKVQYAWPHPSRRYLYVSTSSGGPRVKSDYNHVSAFAIGRDGALSPHGTAKPLSRRAVHMCVDPTGRYALNGHNFPTSGVTVHCLEPDGTVGAEVQQAAPLDYGIYPHQVMMFPSGRTALIVDRGNKPQAGKAEDPGALRSFGFNNGVLSAGQVVAPNGGYSFGPRHVSFHPDGPWLYASDERTNRLYMFRFRDDRIEPGPAFTRETLADPATPSPRQLAGPIHVHPSGICVYAANRADHSVEYAGRKVFAGGENNIAVYAIDPETGEPTLIQHADTHSFHVRTFAFDPSGRLLVTASIKAHAVREGAEVRPVPAALSVFRIGQRGRLEFVRKYEIETTRDQLQYWIGIIRVD
jgi:6-phosphogluconolactonase